MEKGILSKASQDALLVLAAEGLKDQKPIVKLGASLGIKIIFVYADDILAEKLPEDLKVKCRAFLDCVLVSKDYELAIELGIELIPLIYELFQKPTETV